MPERESIENPVAEGLGWAWSNCQENPDF